jgi:DeoR family fructose operon transcriptional repressor
MVGPLTRLLLQELHVDKAFMGTIGFSAQGGFDDDRSERGLHEGLVTSQARQVIVLADSSKAGKVSFAAPDAGRMCRC